jgi:hypothetical protein
MEFVFRTHPDVKCIEGFGDNDATRNLQRNHQSAAAKYDSIRTPHVPV